MDIKQAIESRHSVRSYINRNIKNDIKIQLEDCIIKCNLPIWIKYTADYR